MPVTASMAPSTPRTPNDTVAMRGANNALSSALSQVVLLSGSPAPRARRVSCNAVATCCGSPFDLTTTQVPLVGDWDCRMGRKKRGQRFFGNCLVSSVLYHPGYLDPLSPGGLEVTADGLRNRAKFPCPFLILPIQYLNSERLLTRPQRSGNQEAQLVLLLSGIKLSRSVSK